MIYKCNTNKELPLHWACQYGNNHTLLVDTMIQFVLQQQQRPSTSTTATSRSSQLQQVQQLLHHEDRQHRNPIDVARFYHNDSIVQYLQSYL
jgi:ankyrin repeat protein